VTAPAVLIMAKVPIPGLVKTRLAATEGPVRAAQLATAALLDTLEVCAQVFDPDRRHIALGGQLEALEGTKLAEQLRSWRVHPQQGAGLAARIANAHREMHLTSTGPVVQIGMDTPHVSAATLRSVGRMVTAGDPVLGFADDGGWWVLATSVASQVDGLERVPMSTPRTGRRTWELLRRGGAVGVAPAMRDVDDAGDAEHVASLAPSTRFARTWRAKADQ